MIDYVAVTPHHNNATKFYAMKREASEFRRIAKTSFAFGGKTIDGISCENCIQVVPDIAKLVRYKIDLATL
ncbi:hypothetical protein [Sphingomonas faeni]|uniref:hypothetical protein n=1 Tax=Sphingomonas faeni TaxID=185950 RepID=UPI00277DA69B|nr:hypothetical protein [Sphingomonas faeni]MDQ0839222.1 hypothetical protein [Sphingomonas faeni]